MRSAAWQRNMFVHPLARKTYDFPRIFPCVSAIMVWLWCTLNFNTQDEELKSLLKGGTPQMKFLTRAFTPTKNRRLNELIGFLLLASAALLFLALASYSPADPSLNTAGPLNRGASNWIGLFGAMVSDLMVQSVGVCVFLLPL